MKVTVIVQQQKDFFKSQVTKNVAFRKAALKRLRDEMVKREKDIINALYADFQKPEFESVGTETMIVFNELDRAVKKLNSWSRPHPVRSVLLNFPSRSKIYKEPYGTVLIISPWNFPFLLALSPLIGAVAAGNTVVLKPSELAPHTGKVISELILSAFDKSHVCVVEGDAGVAEELLQEYWDYIFFTGSTVVGKIVAMAAAVNLTPVTLELGGKNPCIIDETANLKLASRRIAWGKFINGGQTCIAPDYILIHSNVKEKFIGYLKDEIIRAYGENPFQSADYPRIINPRNFNRLKKILGDGKLLMGGETDEQNLYISPTLLDNPGLNSEIMKGEIFGPILPVLTYTDESEIEKLISVYGKPLAFYVFSGNRKFAARMIRTYSFGGGTLNDTIVHFANHHLPFGGVGFSGIGSYHGKYSFDTFSHRKGITRRYNWLDIPVRYPPYHGKLKMLKFLMKWFG